MNLQDIIKNSEKNIATKNILQDKGSATLIQLKKGAVLKEHQSTTKAILVLIAGKAIYEEKERKEHLSVVSDFVHIPEHVTHKVTGIEDTLLLLIQ
ncbi:MAG: hypothetical protein R2825_05545 [Saprospiraceae bacterium]